MATGKSAHLSAETISLKEFQEALEKYPSLVKAVSAAKGAKAGQQSLEELDHYRYVVAVDSLSSGQAAREMELSHVNMLVQWKLRHGKFRPTLMKLVSSNDPDTAKVTISRAVRLLHDKRDVSGALTVMCELRGIGPATASLLLSVHDPDKTIFFGDEVYYWLCCDSKPASAKYSAKEYMELHKKATATANRLNVRMAELEKVAYVVVKQGLHGDGAGDGTGEAAGLGMSSKGGGSKASVPKKTPAKGVVGSAAAKRKVNSDEDEQDNEAPTLRRSKRGKGT